MPSAMRKMAVYLGLVEDQDGYDGYDRYDEEDASADAREDTRTAPAHAPVERRVEGALPARGGATVATLADRRPVPAPAAPSPADLTRITTVHPRTYNEARTIGEHFREGTPVILNLSGMDDGDAKRLVDFSAGLIFGLRGTLERITSKVFLLSPQNVSVTAEDKARIAEGGFFNQS